jgi:hypothetical protein
MLLTTQTPGDAAPASAWFKQLQQYSKPQQPEQKRKGQWDGSHHNPSCAMTRSVA